MELIEKIGYLKGLADGVDLDKTTKEGKIIAALMDVVDLLANRVVELEQDVEELNDYCEELDEDLGDVEEVLLDLDEDDELCDGDCDCCDGCDDYDMEDTYEVECPKCHEIICFDESLDPSDLTCPACGEKIDCRGDKETEE